MLFIGLLLFISSALSASPGDGVPSELLEAATRLPDRTMVPDAWFQKYATQEIAEALVHRLRTIRDGKKSEKPSAPLGFDLWNGTEIRLHFHSPDAHSIVQKGFLNIHQTETSGGIYFPSSRLQNADEMLGLRISRRSNKEPNSPFHDLRPKSAFLDFIEPRWAGTLKRFDGGFHYGDCVAVMKNEVKRRATWTPLDSLSAKPGEVRTFWYEGERILSDNYYEAQIWGAVDTRDVRYFMVPPGSPAGLIAVLNQGGIPVYEYQEIMQYGRARRLARKLLTPQGAGEMPRKDDAVTLKEVKERADWIVDVTTIDRTPVRVGNYLRLPDGDLLDIVTEYDSETLPFRWYRGVAPDGNSRYIFLTKPGHEEVGLERLRKLQSLGLVPEALQSGKFHLLTQGPKYRIQSLSEHYHENRHTHSADNCMGTFYLRQIFKRLAEAGVYIEGIQPTDLIYEKTDSFWIFLDFERIQQGTLPSQEIMARYESLITDTWTNRLQCALLLRESGSR